MKTRQWIFTITLLAGLAMPLLARGPNGPNGPRGPNGPGTAPTVTTAQAEALVFLWQEEKLARDVYTAMYAFWGEAIFDNISQSEQRHMDAVKNLLVKYDVEVDLDDTPGVFTATIPRDLQEYYDGLIAQGEASLEGALTSGVTIEENDIDDIVAMKEDFDQPDILRVLDNLLDGSRNHLTAFNSALEGL
ncbi:MAG: DUF2202 domain-containing protein [Phycisphaerae bacterium]|nr:DUF2202 domain-containing protein [Phycisphaerae bacterium]